MNEEVEKALNNQIKTEAHASATYLAMSAWCGEQGYDLSAGFFAKQAEEERSHMLKLFKYVMIAEERQYRPKLPTLKPIFSLFVIYLNELLPWKCM